MGHFDWLKVIAINGDFYVRTGFRVQTIDESFNLFVHLKYSYSPKKFKDLRTTKKFYRG